MAAKKCPCQSDLSFAKCCQPCLTGKKIPTTCEALVRARYTAYTLSDIDYVKSTMKGPSLIGFSKRQAKFWSEQVKWLGLEILSTEEGGAHDEQGKVSFIATYEAGGHIEKLSEVSQFKKKKDRWFYMDGQAETLLEDAKDSP